LGCLANDDAKPPLVLLKWKAISVVGAEHETGIVIDLSAILAFVLHADLIVRDKRLECLDSAKFGTITLIDCFIYRNV
jgi:hypothetical protein